MTDMHNARDNADAALTADPTHNTPSKAVDATAEQPAIKAAASPQPSKQLGWSELADRAAIEDEPLRARGLLYGIAAVVLLLIVWSSFAEIDTVTRGQGKVIPSQQVQVIGSQDGGVIREILISEGDAVQAGDLLLRLDQTRSQATLGENRVELRGLSIKASRLQAMVEGEPFEPTELMLAELPDVVEQEDQLYQSSLQSREVEKDIAQQQLQQRSEELAELKARESQLSTEQRLAQQELDVTRPMVASGAVSEVEILRLEREVNRASGELAQTRAQINRVGSAIAEAQGRVNSVELEFANEAREQLTETMTRINALSEAAEGLSDRVRQTNVTAPVSGTVNQLYYNTVGGVVLPGRDIVELVPADDTLLLEVRVRPQDIAFLAPGQRANVKVTAYDFVVYGGLEGRVEQIAADTVLDEDGNAFYEVSVRTEQADFGPESPIIPGMTVEVDVITGKKTVLAYLMKPVLRARQRALSER
ncbi:HlyD family type I secretion periplasmic adaptor subunit [Congregibacter sp.]|uniref:HlyD family type I secretion periplasmic adaptor subunit n=1 Tax=Congregibacter sp. TaxID=2744308 RepID=UPI003F6C3134